ncbi:TPA: hypothetical protein ROX88_001662 [Bacillus pseudomycoides]|nr:hypothetical protein [Bacillus pseudomycoides]
MKRFISLFMVLQFLLLTFIFTTSIYDIYEKNHIIHNGDQAYQLKNPTGENLGKLYDNMLANGHRLEFIRTKPNIENHTNYTIYYSDPSAIQQRKAVARNVTFDYVKIQREDFVDSTGIFYTNIHSNKVKKIASDLNLSIEPYVEDQISYRQILIVNGVNLLFLLIFTILIYFLYISSDFKKIAIKKSLGFTNGKIITSYVYSLLKKAALYLLIIDLICVSYFVFKGSFSVNFLLLLIVYSVSILIINIGLIYISLLLIRFIHINEMIKNRNFNNVFHFLLITIKWIVMAVVSVAIAYFTTNYAELKKTSGTIKKYVELADYYTANGFSSNAYEVLLKNPSELEKFSENVKKMVVDESAYLSDASNLSQDEGDEKYPYVISNSNYIHKFTDLKNSDGKPITLTDGQNSNVDVLIPEQFKSEEQKIKTFIQENVIDNYIHYDKYYGIEKSDSKTNLEINMIYIKNNQSTSILTDKGFKTWENLIFIVDYNYFSGMYYADALNGRHIYFSFDSRDIFQQKLEQYGINQIVSPGTLLTPYLIQLENYQFILYNVSVFIIIFIFVLLFFIYISNRTTILSNRKKYGVQTLLGYSKWRILSSYLIAVGLLALICLLLTAYNRLFIIFFIILLLDGVVLLQLYRFYILKDLSNSIKRG